MSNVKRIFKRLVKSTFDGTFGDTTAASGLNFDDAFDCYWIAILLYYIYIIGEIQFFS